MLCVEQIYYFFKKTNEDEVLIKKNTPFGKGILMKDDFGLKVRFEISRVFIYSFLVCFA